MYGTNRSYSVNVIWDLMSIGLLRVYCRRIYALHGTAKHYMVQPRITWYSYVLHGTAMYYLVHLCITWYTYVLYGKPMYYMV